MSNPIVSGVIGGIILSAIITFNPFSKQQASQQEKMKYAAVWFLVGFFICVVSSKLSQNSNDDKDKEQYVSIEQEEDKRKECCNCN